MCSRVLILTLIMQVISEKIKKVKDATFYKTNVKAIRGPKHKT